MQTDKLDISELHKHPYINLIEYALKNNSFTISDACNYAHISPDEFNYIKDIVFVLNASQKGILHEKEILTWQLSPQAFFYYLQYREFKFAIDSAEKSKRNAWIAIWIAAVTFIAGVLALFI